ncbi:MAG: pilus assembly protein TadG-related protein, partial [Chloroflexota bacterium]
MIFVAVLMSALMGTVGLAVEGGHAFVEYRRLQSAADMSALVGAQSLPCNTGDTTCVSAAESLACTYASNNGFSSCNAGGADWPSANVPPLSCSPYDFVDYGNQDGNCKSKDIAPFYDYIETRLTDNLGTIPIFNIPVTLSAHAIAKRGIGVPGDFAVISLSPTTPLNVFGNGTLNTVGSIFSNGGVNGNGSQTVTCDGGWFAATSPAGISNVQSNSSGQPVFAPSSCTGVNDATPVASQNLPPITDPYAGSSPPPASPSSFANCPECASPGVWFDLGTDPNNASNWHVGGSPSGQVEMFPGVYDSISKPKNGSQIYLNPGVYTFTNGIDTQHANLCIYGSPACMVPHCYTDTFSAGTSAGDIWNYECSPYGFWDSALAAQIPAADGGPILSAPTFFDSSTGAASTVPLNGITIYLPPGPSSVKINGNSSQQGLAAPNPCPGTGTWSPGVSVPFTTGSSAAYYSYPASYGQNNDGVPNGGVTVSPTSTYLYPNTDWSVNGDCT